MFDFDVRSGSENPESATEADLSEESAIPPSADPLSDFSEPISAIPRRAPLVVPPACRLREAFRLMADRQAAAVLVASHGVLLGMLNERQLVRRLLAAEDGAGDLPVWRVMAAQPETLLESDTVRYAARKLRTLGVQAMPILRPSGALFGLLDTRDLMSWMCGRVGAAPPAAGAGDHE